VEQRKLQTASATVGGIEETRTSGNSIISKKLLTIKDYVIMKSEADGRKTE
jgi:hypothetical protein